MYQKLMTDFYKIIKFDKNNKNQKNKNKIYGYNSKTYSWHCVECGIDMGINNPRQLCGKIYCVNI